MTKKYTQPPQAGKEEFYAIAWTTLALRSKQEDTSISVIAAAGTQGDIKLIDYEAGQLFNILLVPNAPGMPTGTKKSVNHITFSPKHPWLMFTAHANGSILVWSITAPKPRAQCRLLAHLVGHKGPVYDVSVSPNGEQVISGGADKTLRRWVLPESLLAKADMENDTIEIRDNQQIQLAPLSDCREVDTAQFVNESVIVCKDSSSGTIALLDIKDDPPQAVANLKWWLKEFTPGEVKGLFTCFLKGYVTKPGADGNQWLVVGKNDGRVNVYSLSAVLGRARKTPVSDKLYPRTFGLCARQSRGAGRSMWGATQSRSGKYIACGSSRNAIFVWEREPSNPRTLQ